MFWRNIPPSSSVSRRSQTSSMLPDSACFLHFNPEDGGDIQMLGCLWTIRHYKMMIIFLKVTAMITSNQMTRERFSFQRKHTHTKKRLTMDWCNTFQSMWKLVLKVGGRIYYEKNCWLKIVLTAMTLFMKKQYKFHYFEMRVIGK